MAYLSSLSLLLSLAVLSLAPSRSLPVHPPRPLEPASSADLITRVGHIAWGGENLSGVCCLFGWNAKCGNFDYLGPGLFFWHVSLAGGSRPLVKPDWSPTSPFASPRLMRVRFGACLWMRKAVDSRAAICDVEGRL